MALGFAIGPAIGGAVAATASVSAALIVVAGLALALAADIRLVSPTAKFSAAFLKVGLSMGELGTSYNLSRLIGPGRAAEIGRASCRERVSECV